MPKRRRLPVTRKSITHKVEITDPSSGTYSVYIIMGKYPRGKPGEVFIKMGKVGSTVNGLLDAVGILTSLLMQHGVDQEHLCNKMEGLTFSPAGTTDNPEIPECKSIVDYVFRWVESQRP